MPWVQALENIVFDSIKVKLHPKFISDKKVLIVFVNLNENEKTQVECFTFYLLKKTKLVVGNHLKQRL